MTFPKNPSRPNRSPFDDFLPQHEKAMERLDTQISPAKAPERSPEPGIARTNEKVQRTPSEILESRRRLLPLEDTLEAPPAPLAIILHAHLPWVLGHGRWPHGEEWLTEAILFSYLPLIGVARHFRDQGRKALMTLSVSPTLAAQLADSRTPDLVDEYFDSRLHLAREALGVHPLQSWWVHHYESLRREWQDIDRDVIGALRLLAQENVLELSTSAATHAYLPLAPTSSSVHLQLRTAVRAHRRIFGLDPLGCWLPECAYRPSGPWSSATGDHQEGLREGLEDVLDSLGLHWTVLDTHLADGGMPLLPYRAQSESPDIPWDSLPRRHPPLRIGNSKVTALIREPVTARQVWSRSIGYPGDPRYLDFHKRHETSGLRLWRVSHPESDLGDKLPYWPSRAKEAIESQARHFGSLIRSLPSDSAKVVVAPFDAELFGHWWFEGPQWIRRLLEAGPHPTIETTTPSALLAQAEPISSHSFIEGSWGQGGRHEVWSNEATRFIWEILETVTPKVEAALRGEASAQWKTALANQLLLASSSDWPFLITTQTAPDYAEQRFRLHHQRILDLLNHPEERPSRFVADQPFTANDLFDS